MALRRDENQYPHIPFAREPGIEPQRRGRRAPRAGVRAPADRVQHGHEINEQLTASLAGIRQSRVSAGIEPGNLIVLEFGSIGFDLEETFAERFGVRMASLRQATDTGKNA